MYRLVTVLRAKLCQPAFTIVQDLSTNKPALFLLSSEVGPGSILAPTFVRFSGLGSLVA